ncbi:chorismate mutase [Alteriqipengyuania lutimaris]|uniref:chorismate mutase n=1 Tax=Alteriqipengyuania lutimaris TaxID=1538146 RepID=A0A395LQV8_9SPHN|nr:chorismate mutase [Alteriqipengyuania lutimaris]MBB3032990.1 isochorismate pyruvate lyase [Alteriqipengyuania lutimaris]RDS77934.1 chorismate mutase [Alteriqipengyuania lutimaris]
MSDTVLAPEECETMAEVRAGVDALDRELMQLIAVRFGYMRAAARIKPDRGHVRDEARKAQVIENVREDARRENLPEEAIGDIWEALVEASIAYEMIEWDRIRGGAS